MDERSIAWFYDLIIKLPPIIVNSYYVSCSVDIFYGLHVAMPLSQECLQSLLNHDLFIIAFIAVWDRKCKLKTKILIFSKVYNIES